MVTNVATAPVPCTAGYFTTDAGQSVCTATQAGYYSNGTLTDANGVVTPADAQVPCPVGTYQPTTAQASCIDADAGYYSCWFCCRSRR